MIDIEPRLDRLRPVVRAAGELASATNIAGPVDLGPVVAIVVAGAAFLAGKASGQPIDESRLVDGELDHVVDREAALRQHPIERLRLRQSSWETVEYETV